MVASRFTCHGPSMQVNEALGLQWAVSSFVSGPTRQMQLLARPQQQRLGYRQCQLQLPHRVRALRWPAHLIPQTCQVRAVCRSYCFQSACMLLLTSVYSRHLMQAPTSTAAKLYGRQLPHGGQAQGVRPQASPARCRLKVVSNITDGECLCSLSKTSAGSNSVPWCATACQRSRPCNIGTSTRTCVPHLALLNCCSC